MPPLPPAFAAASRTANIARLQARPIRRWPVACSGHCWCRQANYLPGNLVQGVCNFRQSVLGGDTVRALDAAAQAIESDPTQSKPLPGMRMQSNPNGKLRCI
jgi:hypothetical protein